MRRVHSEHDQGAERTKTCGPRGFGSVSYASAATTRQQRVIVVDTPVWIDHLHSAEPALVELLGRDEGVHPLVIEELALGSIKHRGEVLELVGRLRMFP